MSGRGCLVLCFWRESLSSTIHQQLSDRGPLLVTIGRRQERSEEGRGEILKTQAGASIQGGILDEPSGGPAIPERGRKRLKKPLGAQRAISQGVWVRRVASLSKEKKWPVLGKQGVEQVLMSLNDQLSLLD